MAVREGEDRRVGVGPEKLLTLEEAARRLEVPADDVEAFVRSGKLTAFRLGGHLLRLRQSEVEALRRLRPAPQDSPGRRPEGRGAASPTFLSREVPRSGASSSGSRWDRIVDFFYFNDFYLIALLIALTLLAVIVSL